MEQQVKVKIPIVFIPVYNDLESLKLCIHSLFDTTRIPFHLLIIESGSTDGAKEYCDLLPKMYPKESIEIIHTPKEGAVKAYNQAFKTSAERKQDIYMTQTDVVHFRHTNRDWMEVFLRMRYLIKERLGCITAGNAMGVSGSNYYPGVMWAGFWSVYIPWETCEKIGGFDDKFEIGDGVDIDWSYRLWKENLPVYISNIVVDHHHFTAHKNEDRKDLEDIKTRNGRYFRKKHKLGEFAE